MNAGVDIDVVHTRFGKPWGPPQGQRDVMVVEHVELEQEEPAAAEPAGQTWLQQMLAAAASEVAEAQTFLADLFRTDVAEHARPAMPLAHTQALIAYLSQLDKE